jgi:methylmalonyl-CoA/ethylmalonyl-CoA epimerase
MKYVDHIGIAVKDLKVSISLFEKLLNTICDKREFVEDENVTTAFFKTSETKIELLQDESENGIIKKFIEKKGEGIHHIAFEVENIQDEIKRLKQEGFVILNEVPKKGADNKLVCFLHPKCANGVLVELCQQIK